jgi:homoserine kinase type II
LNSGHDPAYEDWVRKSLARLDVGSFSDLPRGLIHADAFADNVLFDGDKLVGIIDFELACNYLFAFDLAMAVIGLCLHDGQPCRRKINSLILGYEEIRCLSANELGAIKQLAEYAAIMTSLWRYWRYRCHEPHHVKQSAYLYMADVAHRIVRHDFEELENR